MKKVLPYFVLCGLVMVSSAMINFRVAATKMHGHYQVPRGYKVSMPEIEEGKPQTQRRSSTLDCAQVDTWSKRFVALTMCTALVRSAAAVYTRDPNACLSDFSRPSTYKEARLRLPDTHRECHPPHLQKNETAFPIFFDDGKRCYLKPDKTTTSTYGAIFLKKLHHSMKLLKAHERKHYEL